jgi:spermidine/putrescine transport system permease protein
MKRDRLLGRYALISPAAILIFVFMLLPMLLMALMSWLEAGQFGGVKWGSYTPEAYVKFLFDRDLSDNLVFNSDYLSIFSRSFQLAGITTLLTLLVAFPIAFYIALQTPKHRTWLMLLITIPFWTNLLVRTYAWILLLRNGGLIDSSLHSLGIISTPINLMYTFMVLPIYTSLEKLDWRLLEAAYDLYANRWQTLRRIVIPLAAPGMVAGCILVFVPALGTFFIPELLGGAKTLMIGNLIQQQFGVSRNWPFGAALSFALLAVVLIFMLIYALRFRGKGSLT